MTNGGPRPPPPDTDSWSGLEIVEPVLEGNRNDVWRGRIGDRSVAIRRSRRSVESLRWELTAIERLAAMGFTVPTVVATDRGEQHVDGLVVQRWIDGRPPTSAADWRLVATELHRLHTTTLTLATEIGQRPGCCSVGELGRLRRSVDADLDRIPDDVMVVLQPIFDQFATHPAVLVHGDPGASNLRITAAGSVGLLDWDESRLDVAWHDLSNLEVQVLDHAAQARADRLSHAWEVANGWTAEPAYARRRLGQLTATERIPPST